MLGYKFNTEAAAQKACGDCTAHHLPVVKGFTNKWCSYLEDKPGHFYYIPYYPSLEIVLGKPVEIEITKDQIVSNK